MKEIVYKIVDGYPIVDYPPALDETFKAGTREVIEGVEVFTPQELQDAINANKTKEDLQNQIQEAKAYLTDTGWIWEKYNRNVLVLKDMTNEEFNLKYSGVISKQEEYRALINELEVQLGGN